MKRRLFVIDDDSSVRESLKKVLESSGYSVTTAANGSEIEARLDNPDIDLLILDLNMPQRDGWDVLEETASKHLLTPVIVITGMADQLETLSIPGVAALFKKPVDVPVLLKRIEELLAETSDQRMQRITRSLDAQMRWDGACARHDENHA